MGQPEACMVGSAAPRVPGGHVRPGCCPPASCLWGPSLSGTVPGGAKVGTYLASLSALSGLFCACALIPAEYERTVLRPAAPLPSGAPSPASTRRLRLTPPWHLWPGFSRLAALSAPERRSRVLATSNLMASRLIWWGTSDSVLLCDALPSPLAAHGLAPVEPLVPQSVPFPLVRTGFRLCPPAPRKNSQPMIPFLVGESGHLLRSLQVVSLRGIWPRGSAHAPMVRSQVPGARVGVVVMTLRVAGRCPPLSASPCSDGSQGATTSALI